MSDTPPTPPTPGFSPVTWSIDALSRQVNRLEGKVDELIGVGVGARLDDMNRRVTGIESTLSRGQSQRSVAAWQFLFIAFSTILALGCTLAVALTR